MSNSGKTLNIADIVFYKKDLLWGKYYYGRVDKGKLQDCILFKKLYDSKKLIEILNIENKNTDLVKEFTKEYSRKKKVRYFIQELNEITQGEDIEFIQSCGFRRFTRNYCFECNGTETGLKSYKHLDVFCREMDMEDINDLVELDQDCQIVDFRDAYFKPKKYFKNNFEDIYVFSNPSNTQEIYAFAYRPDTDYKDCFEFVLHPNRSNLIYQCVSAFNEKYIHFDKNATSFSFIVNENQKSELENIRKKHKLEWTSQKLILEGAPKSKVPQISKAVKLAGRAETA